MQIDPLFLALAIGILWALANPRQGHRFLP
jgi:hypothetical protein